MRLISVARLAALCALAVAFASLVLPNRAAAATHLAATTYTANTTWTAAGSPYVLDGNVTVAVGATLTVDPGVVVKFNGTFRQLNVSGSLRALGTTGSHVSFTSLQDDTLGGDTGGGWSDGGRAGPVVRDRQCVEFGLDRP